MRSGSWGGRRLVLALLLAAAACGFGARAAEPGTEAHASNPAGGVHPGTAGSGTHHMTPKSPILLEADQVDYDTVHDIVTARGHVEIADDQRVLIADTVSYNRKTDEVTAEGHVSLLDPDGNVGFADHVVLTRDLREGAMQGFSALLGPNGRLAANSAERHEGRYTIAHAAVYTPCKICRETGDTTPVWQIRAARIDHDQLTHEIRFHDATFAFLGQPVAYLPFFATPDPTVRHQSGFLKPSFGTSSTLGSFARVPYYVAFSDSQDLTIDPFVSTGAGDILYGEYRLRLANGGGLWLQGSVGYNGNASPIEHEWMSHLFGSGRIPLGGTWRLGFDVQLTSNATYLRIYDISDYDRLNSDLFVESVDGRNRFAATAYYFQGLRPTDLAAQIPFVLPLLEYTYIPQDRVLGGRLRVDASALALYRSEGEDVLRGSTSVDWYLPYTTDNGQIFSFEGLLRGDVYHVNDAIGSIPTATSNTVDTSRGLAVGVFQWRWPFVREHTFGNANLVVEPIVQLAVSPYGGNQTSIPNEDSTSFLFDEINLFNIDVFPGLDRVSEGPRIDAGTRVSAIFGSGLVEAMIGQEYRFKADHTFPSSLGIGGDHSDVVGRFKVEFPPYFQMIHRWRIDPETGSVRDNEVYLSGRYERYSVDISYLKLSQEEIIDPTLQAREEVDADAQILIYGNWSIFGLARRNLEDSQMIETRAGLSYEDECFIASLGYRRRYTRDRDLQPGTSVIFTIGFKTGVGEDNTPGLNPRLPSRDLPL